MDFAGQRPSISPSDEKMYRLVIMQQPRIGRTCGHVDKGDRRVIDPPPILQLHIENRHTGRPYQAFLEPSSFILYASIGTPEEFRRGSPMQNKYAAGSLAANLMRLKDPDNVEGAFFVFPQLGVKVEGTFQIRFNLFEIDGSMVLPRAQIFSDPFIVYSPRQFPGPFESTFLSRTFADQGVKIRKMLSPSDDLYDEPFMSQTPQMGAPPHVMTYPIVQNASRYSYETYQ
ncbi:hypothetical protein SmJEL517_g04216 [Synchytrium microbalum]|uniref:Velvet domain-containing protein n=1 Tax=Synchytrium microbalum TaxID=1806994 RepID=A0A507BT37_9FUNG|nr:uncharacterized protein SmJEL517_g04216 [Synchytrium microbalum]TPX32740.1 hypothetical protein SmJEL517_g04216 [Synchytrium microbalum]